MEIDFQKLNTDLIPLENCELGFDEGKVVNLHPELPIPSDDLHTDMSFPWLGFVHEHFPLEDIPPTFESENFKITDMHMALGGTFSISTAWEPLKKAWSLTLNDKNDLASTFLTKYAETTNYKESLKLDSIIFHFSTMLVSPGKYHLFENVAKEIESIKNNNPLRFSEFQTYFKNELLLEHREKYLDIYSNYFKQFTEYSQVLLYSKNCKDIDETFKTTSANFKKTKMFYGDAFEIITASFTVLACLNNLKNGRPFDTFESMNLSKYVTIDKAKRSNPFKNINCFREFSDCIDSTIRNASHHKSMKIDKNKIISYRSPGSANWKKLPYIKYLYMCNEIMLSICALHMVELLIAYE
jgi:hypothetical protein